MSRNIIKRQCSGVSSQKVSLFQRQFLRYLQLNLLRTIQKQVFFKWDTVYIITLLDSSCPKLQYNFMFFIKGVQFLRYIQSSFHQKNILQCWVQWTECQLSLNRTPSRLLRLWDSPHPKLRYDVLCPFYMSPVLKKIVQLKLQQKILQYCQLPKIKFVPMVHPVCFLDAFKPKLQQVYRFMLFTKCIKFLRYLELNLH